MKEEKQEKATLDRILEGTKEFVKENKGFCVGMGMYALTASTDAYLTAHSIQTDQLINGSLEYEGSLFVREFMENCGVGLGLALHKTCVGSGFGALSLIFKNLGEKEDSYFYMPPNKKWYANIPIYSMALAQAGMTALWYYLPNLTNSPVVDKVISIFQ